MADAGNSTQMMPRARKWLVWQTCLITAATFFLVSIVFNSLDSSNSFRDTLPASLLGSAAVAVMLAIGMRMNRVWIRVRLRNARRRILSDPIGSRTACATIDNAYLRASDLDGRIDEWRNMVLACPSSAWVHYYLGLALDEKKFSSDAVQALKRARELDHDNVEIGVVLSQALLSCCEYEQAMVELRRAHRLAPDNARVTEMLIAAILGAGQTDEARQEAVMFSLAGGKLDPRIGKMLGL